MKELSKLIEKKMREGKGMSPVHVKVKSSVLEHFRDDMDAMGADKVKGLKKVSVMAPDQKGLEHGLAKAAELVEKGPMAAMEDEEVSDHGENEEESPEHEAMESSEEEHMEHEEESPEDLEEKIRQLQEKLHAMRG